MERKSGTASRAGGFIIAMAVLAGAFIGRHFGQSSIGFLIGTGVGIAICLALYTMDRRRA